MANWAAKARLYAARASPRVTGVGAAQAEIIGHSERDSARPRIGVKRQPASMPLGDVQDDRPCLEQDEIAFLIGRNLAERMKRQVRGLLQCTERNKTNLAG